MKIIFTAFFIFLWGFVSFAEQENSTKKLSSPIKADLIHGHSASHKQIEIAKSRGRESAKRDIKNGIFRILYFGKPWSVGKPLIDETTGYKVQIVAGCIVTAEFVEEVGAYNAIMKKHHKEQLVSIYILWKSMGTGLGENAIKSPFGRYLLLKNKSSILALKLEKHLPRKTSVGTGKASHYSWVLLIDGKQKKSGSFDIDEEKGEGSARIKVGGFNCEWSFGDWIYFDPKLSNMKMAKTEATEKSELDELNSLVWWSRNQLRSYFEGTLGESKLRQAMGLEPKGRLYGEPRTILRATSSPPKVTR
jgi:hypothetical protein